MAGGPRFAPYGDGKVPQSMTARIKARVWAYSPLWLRDRWREYRLKQKLSELETTFRPFLESDDPEVEQGASSALGFESEEYRHNLAAIESRRIYRAAKRWLVELPPSSDAATYEWSDPHTGKSYIRDQARRRLRHQIRAARKTEINWWIQTVVMPLLGVIGAAAALVSVLKK